jgi:23S rRNA (adenine1618-N6)-methyltransferase
MQKPKQDKPSLHPRNKHKGRYDFKKLIHSSPELAAFVVLNKYKVESINFSDPKAVLMLNRALLSNQYGIKEWNIPEGYLCPPIPGRADYIHHIADLLSSTNHGKIPKGDKVRCLDIGVGANCIYPIVGTAEYGWSFVGSDIDSVAIQSAQHIVEHNPSLQGKMELRLQKNPKGILEGVFKVGEKIDVTICNPPFHSSAEEAKSGTLRKLSNLYKKKASKATLNFGGQNNELWCEGGEKKFISDMVYQSKQFSKSCLWFTTLVSKQSNLNSIYLAIKKVDVVNVRTIEMGQGNKVSRFVAWSFLTLAEQKTWVDTKW